MIDYNEMGIRIRESREQSGYTRLKVWIIFIHAL